MATGLSIGKDSATAAAPDPPNAIWPAAPMLMTPARKHSAMPAPDNRYGVARFSDTATWCGDPSAPLMIAMKASRGLRPDTAMSAAAHSAANTKASNARASSLQKVPKRLSASLPGAKPFQRSSNSSNDQRLTVGAAWRGTSSPSFSGLAFATSSSSSGGALACHPKSDPRQVERAAFERAGDAASEQHRD